MHIQVLYFAIVREKLGRSEERLTLPDGATVAAARQALAAAHPEITPLLPSLQFAVNQRIARDSHTLSDNDELALIPPVAGGSGGRKIAILQTPLSLAEVIACVEGPTQGGLATFTGVVRRRGHLAEVQRLEYEAYVPMAEAVLRALADEIEAEWPGVRVAMHHRVGTLSVGEAAVAIAASAPHRAEAFAACRAAIDRLKERAPIWKKEIGPDGAVWVGCGP